MTQNLQEEYYDDQSDYWSESPHLKHRRLNELLIGVVTGEIASTTDRGLSGSVLEIGGGDGTITEKLLAQGFPVTSTDMSAASVARMAERFHHNDRFHAVHDETGSMDAVGDKRFSAIVFASVLHHIPDYLSAIESAATSHLEPGGTIVSVQDPLWYSRVGGYTRTLDKVAYLSWRIARGDTMRGIKTRLRRATSGLSETEVGDAVEYHVVRDGVDELAITESLHQMFETVNLVRYWSSQGSVQQWVGEKLGLANTFCFSASDYRPEITAK